MSWGNMVICFVCIAQRLVSLRRQIKYASVASCSTSTTPAWMWCCPCSICRISLTCVNNDALGISNSIDFWNFQISCNACVPGQNCLQLLGVFPAFGFIFSSLFTPNYGVLPFPPLEVLPFREVTKGKPIMAHFHTVALGFAIFCDEKYLK